MECAAGAIFVINQVVCCIFSSGKPYRTLYFTRNEPLAPSAPGAVLAKFWPTLLIFVISGKVFGQTPPTPTS